MVQAIFTKLARVPDWIIRKIVSQIGCAWIGHMAWLDVEKLYGVRVLGIALCIVLVCLVPFLMINKPSWMQVHFHYNRINMTGQGHLCYYP
jgi:hypothetical protein